MPVSHTIDSGPREAAEALGVHFDELDDGQRKRAVAAWIVGDLASPPETPPPKARPKRREPKRGVARKSRKYPPEIRAAALAAHHRAGTKWGPGPKQHQQVRDALAEELAPVTVAAIVEAAGVKSLAHLRKIAAGGAAKADLARLRPLGHRFDDPWCKGRHLAAIMAAWADEVAKK